MFHQNAMNLITRINGTTFYSILYVNLRAVYRKLRLNLNPSKSKSTRSWIRNVRIDFRTLFFWIWYKIPVRFVFHTCLGSIISLRPCATCESSCEVPEDSRVLRVRRYVPQPPIASKPEVRHNLPPYHRF